MKIDGKKLANEINEDTKNIIMKNKITPVLGIIAVDPSDASKRYMKNKHKAANKVGIEVREVILPYESNTNDVYNVIDAMNADDELNGIIVQLPMPPHIDTKVTENIKVEKDVDGFTDKAIGAILKGEPIFNTCTPAGIVEIFNMLKEEEGYTLDGKNVVIVGRSNIVGKPLAAMLLKENATVTVAHSHTKNLKDITKRADIVISAVGKPNTITRDMVKRGAVVIDVGINFVNGHMVGDVDYEKVKKKASYITPVPGGVGPLTVAMLMRNTTLSKLNSIKE